MEAVSCKALTCRKGADAVQRWGLGGLRVGRFRYERGDPNAKDSAKFIRALCEVDGVRRWLGTEAAASDDVAVERLATTAISMAPLEPLRTAGFALGGESSAVRQCPEVELGGVRVEDELRKWLHAPADGADVHACELDDEERAARTPAACGLDGSPVLDELLFRIFRLLAVGGEMSQHDLKLDAYLDLTRAWYRDLATVYRKTDGGAAAIATVAFSATGPLVLSEGGPRSACLFLVEPKKRTCTIVHSPGAGAW